MKFTETVLISSLIFFFLTSSSNGQLFQLGAGGGLTQILAPESYTNFYSSEWNVGVMAKLGLPLLPITPRAFFLYNSLSGNGFSNTGNESSASGEVGLNITEFGVGLQYNFVPLPTGFDPYIALDLTMTGYSGLTRFGGDVGIGTEITIIPILDFDVFASYKMFNLIGKEDGEDTITALTLDVFVLFSFL